MKQDFSHYNVYSDPDLSFKLDELESKYKIEDEINIFERLVNFSQNENISVHNWFKYREGYSGILVKEIINRYPVSKEYSVLDPFCGSGTTLLEANRCGFNAIGVDVNPMSVDISNCKSQTNLKDIEDISSSIKSFYSNFKLHDKVCNDEFLKKYFSLKNLSDLYAIRNCISNVDNSRHRFIMHCAFISIIEECSDRKRDGNGLKISISKVNNVLEFYLDKLNSIIDDIKRNHNLCESQAIQGSALYMIEKVKKSKCINKGVGHIIFSPPYANSFDYFESYKLELYFGNYLNNNFDLKRLRGEALSSFIGKKNSNEFNIDLLDKINNEINAEIPIKEALTGKKDARTRKVPDMLKGYFSDMEQSLKECFSLLVDKGYCSIVVDQSAYLGKIVPTDLLLAKIAENIGFKVIKIIVCRRAKTSAQQLSKYPYLKQMLRESIVVLQKV